MAADERDGPNWEQECIFYKTAIEQQSKRHQSYKIEAQSVLDEWVHKAVKAQKEVEALQQELRTMEESRDKWKELYLQIEPERIEMKKVLQQYKEVAEELYDSIGSGGSATFSATMKYLALKDKK